MKRRMRLILTILLVVTFCFGISTILPGAALAQPKKPTALEGAVFNTAASLSDNLKIYVGKDIYVHLKSGKTIQGYVKSVGNNLLHLEKLAGKEFYDALVLIEEISAIEAKFRDMK
jgi:hypothetical protein